MSKSELKRLCAVDHVGMAEKMAAQEAELTSLREKNAELQRQLESVRDMRTRAYTTRDAMTDKYLAEKERADRLQRQLDEAAKQEPVVSFEIIDGQLEPVYTNWVPDEGDKLYRHPPNLPALIEQAKAEERERCGDSQYLAGLGKGFSLGQMNDNDGLLKIQNAYIRARSEK